MRFKTLRPQARFRSGPPQRYSRIIGQDAKKWQSKRREWAGNLPVWRHLMAVIRWGILALGELGTTAGATETVFLAFFHPAVAGEQGGIAEAFFQLAVEFD